MSDTVKAIYRGPSGALIAEGHELVAGVLTEIPREVAERIAAYTDHAIEVVTEENPEPTAKRSRKQDQPAQDTHGAETTTPEADSVASPEADAHLIEGAPPTTE